MQVARKRRGIGIARYGENLGALGGLREITSGLAMIVVGTLPGWRRISPKPTTATTGAGSSDDQRPGSSVARERRFRPQIEFQLTRIAP